MTHFSVLLQWSHWPFSKTNLCVFSLHAFRENDSRTHFRLGPIKMLPGLFFCLGPIVGSPNPMKHKGNISPLYYGPISLLAHFISWLYFKREMSRATFKTLTQIWVEPLSKHRLKHDSNLTQATFETLTLTRLEPLSKPWLKHDLSHFRNIYSNMSRATFKT